MSKVGKKSSKPQRVHVDLGKLPELTNDTFYPLYKERCRYLVLRGGGSSGKSAFSAQKLVFRMIVEKPHKFLVVRKVKADIRDSAFAELVNVIKVWGLQDLFYIPTGRSSDLYIQCLLNGNEIIFYGLDDVERRKSLQGITSMWIEEVSELTVEEFRQLNIRMRGWSEHYKQMILSFNPVSITHWLKREFFDVEKDDALLHHSTHWDNRFLPDEDRRVLEGFRFTDPYYYQVYGLGEWGVTGQTVYSGELVTQRLLEVRADEDSPLAVGAVMYELDERERVVVESIRFVEDERGPLRVYEWPAFGTPYVIGCDTAEGGADSSGASVRNNATWNQAAVWHGKTDTDLFAKDMYALGMYYNRALVGIEVNFDTHPVKELSRLEYPRQYVRQRLDRIAKDIDARYGWRTDRVTRPMLIGEHVALAREHIDTFNDAGLLEEMLTFVRDDRGRAQAQEGSHDDLVFADGVALQIRHQQDTRVKTRPKKVQQLPEALRTEEARPQEESYLWD